MIKKLSAYIGKYKMQALLSPILVLFEVVLEVYIPMLMGKIVDVGIPSSDFGYILKMGGLMVLMAVGALVFGALCARVAVVASNGMATNLRKGIFEKIESFSFKNTDHFTTPSLITRLTNDVNNIQNSFQMIIRMLARAPFMLVLATIMAYRISPRLSIVILSAIPALALVMGLLSKIAFPRFEAMLQK